VLARHRDVYLAHLAVERGLSRHTLESYRRDLDRYIAFLGSRGIGTLAEVTRPDVAAFAEALARGGDGGSVLAPASAARTVVAVRGWHRFALAEGWTAQDPAALVAPPPRPQRLPKAIAIDEVQALLEAASVGEGPVPLRDRALLELVYGTGARISEAVGLAWDDISREVGAEQVILRGKGRKERMVPLGSFAAEALDAYWYRGRPALAAKGRGTSALFLNQRGAPLSRQSAWEILHRAATRAGIAHVSPHTLRHSFATHLLAGGADVRVVQELLGHASVTTTQVYTLVTPEALREVYIHSHPRALGETPAGE